MDPLLRGKVPVIYSGLISSKMSFSEGVLYRAAKRNFFEDITLLEKRWC